jgi:beta-glucosidase
MAGSSVSAIGCWRWSGPRQLLYERNLMNTAPWLTEDGFTYRDLNKNGRLDPYEDPRRPLEERVEDLLAQMTLAEKAGLLFHTFIPVDPADVSLEGPGMFGAPGVRQLLLERHMNHFNLHMLPSPRQTAEWHNRLQQLAESTRLGIPVTISSDPRHAFTRNVALGAQTGAFSQWPEPIGLAAAALGGDSALVAEFAQVARQEYLAVGIRTALHPMADLATEPRWGRINGTFGEQAQLAADLTYAYVRGFQGATLGKDSVACMTKHFPGGGPQKDGEDPHFPEGKEQVYPGGNFDYHLIPFEAAFRAGTAQIMPYYGQPVGLPLESVGFGFNKQVITGLLREKYGFDGVICTDWGLLTSLERDGRVIFEARAWGVEHLSTSERARKALEAGVDQFGGEACPQVIVELVRSGQVPQARLDTSVRRLLRDKFRLGLFDNPYLDVEAAGRIAGAAQFRRQGQLAQRKSIVLLKNGAAGEGPLLPLAGRPRLYVEGYDPQTVAAYGQLVEAPEGADYLLLRLAAPYEPRQGFLKDLFHQGDLDFKGAEKERLLALLAKAPAIVDIYLDRPAVIPEIAAHSAAVLANFGAADEAVLDVIFGRFKPSARLPFELPSSMEAVRRQKPDLPHDSENPLYPFGHGLTF